MRNTLACFALAASAVTATAIAQSPTYRTAEEPATDAVLSALPGGPMFAIPGVADDFVLSGGSQFVELPDGTARLCGRIRSTSRIYAAFIVDLQFTGLVQPGDASYPPIGSPDLQLLPTAYTPAGPIDPSTFHYYTSVVGTLNGVRELDGARVALQLTGPAAQVGLGANNRNGLLGIAADFAVQVLQQPTFPFGATSTASLRAVLKQNRSFSATHVMLDAARTPLASDRAMVLPGLPGVFFFVPAATWVEHTDGHAELHGMLARIDALDDKWQLDLVLGSRVDPGQAGCPPTGSPVLGLNATEYDDQGGAIDPDAWHYYQTATGTLTGKGDNDGGLIALSSFTPFQVGAGTNQANLYFGYYGACTPQLLQNPNTHAVALTGGAAEFHGLTSTFPVLPFPGLDVPTTPPQLDTLTDQGLVISGVNLAWVNAVACGSDFLTATSASSWSNGYFRVLDDQHIEVHPIPGHAAGLYSLRMFNPAIVTNSINVELVEPTTPTIVTEATRRTGQTHHMFVHRGTIPGNTISGIAYSSELVPSIQPGFIDLLIGNNFSSIDLLPPVITHDPVTGIGSFAIGPVPAVLEGMQLHFQAIVLELGNHVYPLRTSGVFSTTYTP